MDNIQSKIMGKLPPQNLDSEVSVLGAILLDNESMIKVVDVVSVDDFYRTENQKILLLFPGNQLKIMGR